MGIGISIQKAGETLAEKFSVASNLRGEKLRVISGITALNLIQEEKYDEAEIYARPFVELKKFSVDDLAQHLSYGFVPNRADSREVAEQLMEVSELLSQDPASIEKSKITNSTKKLLGLLNALSNKQRI